MSIRNPLVWLDRLFDSSDAQEIIKSSVDWKTHSHSKLIQCNNNNNNLVDLHSRSSFHCSISRHVSSTNFKFFFFFIQVVIVRLQPELNVMRHKILARKIFRFEFHSRAACKTKSNPCHDQRSLIPKNGLFDEYLVLKDSQSSLFWISLTNCLLNELKWTLQSGFRFNICLIAFNDISKSCGRQLHCLCGKMTHLSFICA